MPKSASSRNTCRLIADEATFSFCAAARIEPDRTTSSK
jgi:hypothetical protein